MKPKNLQDLVRFTRLTVTVTYEARVRAGRRADSNSTLPEKDPDYLGNLVEMKSFQLKGSLINP